MAMSHPASCLWLPYVGGEPSRLVLVGCFFIDTQLLGIALSDKPSSKLTASGP